jgi:hypothetical protein
VNGPKIVSGISWRPTCIASSSACSSQSRALDVSAAATGMAASFRSTEAIGSLEIEVGPHAATTCIFDQAGEVTRHSGEKTKGVRQSRLAATQRHDGLIPLRKSAVEEWPDTVDEPELGVILTAEPLKADQRLEHQREVNSAPRLHIRILWKF